MARNNSVYVCQECGYESKGWMGKCPSCNNWNTFAEELRVSGKGHPDTAIPEAKPLNINDIYVQSEERSTTGIKEMDRVLGGGIVNGSLILVGGDPGIGKSTLLLQVCDKLATQDEILYISGEESVKQIKMRAGRLGVIRENLFMVSETDFSAIEKLIRERKPHLAIIDSIQTVFNSELSSAPGSVSQVREATAGFMKLSKGLGISMIIVGHVTKEGAIAGPRVLEHMVDTVLYFEGERHLSYRILRAVKNRFGSTNEIGIFEMQDQGLVEVDNPSMTMLSGRPEGVPGTVVVSSIEGTRPMLVEIQALVCLSSFGVPRRMATGIDYNRVTLLMAVLEKRVGMQLYNYDAYVNVIGGLKIDEPACDLGIIAAVASSFKDRAIASDTVLIGEVGLTGEVRAVSQVDKRVLEASRIGFKKCVVPAGCMKSLEKIRNTGEMEIKPVDNVMQALEELRVLS